MDVVEETHAQWKALRDGTVENGALGRNKRLRVYVRLCVRVHGGGGSSVLECWHRHMAFVRLVRHILIIFITTLDVVWPSYERYMRLDR